MALSPIFMMPAPRATVVAVSYPYGKFNDESVTGAYDGAYLSAQWVNELFAPLLAAANEIGATLTESPDTADSSQHLDNLKAVMSKPRAPWQLGTIEGTAGTWAAGSEAVNIGTIEGLTGSGNGPDGDLRAVATTAGTANGAVVTPSNDLARLGVIAGSKRLDDRVVVGASTAYGHRAVVMWNGSNAWDLVDASDRALNSESAPTISYTPGATFFEIEFNDATGIQLGDSWGVMPLQGAPETHFTCQRVSGKAGRAVRVYFTPRHPARGRISVSGGFASILTGSYAGIDNAVYDASTRILTIIHNKRTGPAHVTLGSVTSGLYGATPVANAVDEYTTTVALFREGDVLGRSLEGATLNFSREVGASDFTKMTGYATLAITNGFGVVPQDLRTFTGNFNILQPAT